MPLSKVTASVNSLLTWLTNVLEKVQLFTVDGAGHPGARRAAPSRRIPSSTRKP